MPFGIADDIAIQVLVEETTGEGPSPLTANVPVEFRLKVRQEVEAIKRAGGEIAVPAAYPDEDATLA